MSIRCFWSFLLVLLLIHIITQSLVRASQNNFSVLLNFEGIPQSASYWLSSPMFSGATGIQSGSHIREKSIFINCCNRTAYVWWQALIYYHAHTPCISKMPLGNHWTTNTTLLQQVGANVWTHRRYRWSTCRDTHTNTGGGPLPHRTRRGGQPWPNPLWHTNRRAHVSSNTLMMSKSRTCIMYDIWTKHVRRCGDNKGSLLQK